MTIAFHDVRPCHHDAVLAFMRRWETQGAFAAAMPTIMGLSHRRRPEWTNADDELVALTLATG